MKRFPLQQILWMSFIFFGLPDAGASESALAPSDEQRESETVLEPITVIGRRVANTLPANTLPAAVTELRFDPQLDVQSRGMPETQADVSVRGGVFENTGFRIGSIPLFDPQTGHYAVELPIDPAMLGSPRLQTGIDHGLHGFNAAVATVRYDIEPVDSRVILHGGAGSWGSVFGSLLAGRMTTLSSGGELGAEAAIAKADGEGGLPFTDYDVERISGHLSYSRGSGETHALFGYQDKFFGWPGAYTGFATLPETDRSKVGIALLQHRRTLDAGWWELGMAYRWLDDDYDFDRRTFETGESGSFEHETRNFALGASGAISIAGLDWSWSGHAVADRLVRSTDLTNGDFNSRTYLGLGLVPRWRRDFDGGCMIMIGAGLRADISNRDEDALMPLFELAFDWPGGEGRNRIGLEWTRTSQLPGYTALKSLPTGLFGGNPDLGRAYANTAAIGFTHSAPAAEYRASVFYREDDDLVDWTYSSGAPFARQANPVDLQVSGFETVATWRIANAEIIGGYTYLHKDEDYGAAAVDASYYALNYARHRFTAALTWRPVNALTFRLDTEYRVQRENSLRSSGNSAFNGSASVSWRIPVDGDISIGAIIDNLSDDDFEEFPGTPAIGRRASLYAEMVW